ncbi:MAG: hypothetical protein ACOYN5_09240 [Bacteroidales bacterium]
MKARNIIISFIIILIFSNHSFAQNRPAVKDSTKIYTKIESISEKNKFLEFVYQLAFRPVDQNTKNAEAKKKLYKKRVQKPYYAYEGKIIRHINITTMDPFGNSIADTIEVQQSFLSENGNKLHIKTLPITIRNLLLIHPDQVFDSLLVKESERLLRTQNYITDVSFYSKIVSKNADSVDVYIRVLDTWSLIPRVDISPSKLMVNITDNNIMGLGHKFANQGSWYHTSGNFAGKMDYNIPNISNTFINSNLHLSKDEWGNTDKSIVVDRPFFSPFAKWAAGAGVRQQFRKEDILINDSIVLPVHFKYNTQDFWGGNAMQIFKGNTESNRTTNFISTIRYQRIRYLEKPFETADPQHFYSNEDFYLGSLGISERKYIQDKYIFKFGITEDVPVGSVYNLTFGHQRKNNINRFYTGARISQGDYFSWGYLSGNAEFGAFVKSSHIEQGAFLLNMNYFTNVIEIGKWRFRQFAKQQLIIGINRFPSDSLTLNDGYGIDGFNSKALVGTSRMLFTLQTQSYAPWNVIGFRFGPYMSLSIGWLGDEDRGFRKSQAYPQISLGCLIKNENLVISTFQFSISFYPNIPGEGKDIFKMNAFRTTDFGVNDFEIGRPTVVLFQ